MQTQDQVVDEELFPSDSETALVPTEPKYADVKTLTPTAPQAVKPDELPDFDEMEEGTSLQARYREFETEGETVRAMFIGFTQMNNQQGNPIPVAVFQTREGIFVNAGSNLVAQVHNIPARTPVQITYQGKEKTRGGNNVKVFDVRLLNTRAGRVPKETEKKETVKAQPRSPATNFQRDQVLVRYMDLAGINDRLKAQGKLDLWAREKLGHAYNELTEPELATVKAAFEKRYADNGDAHKDL